MLLTLLPQSRESKSRTWGTLFQLSPSAGLGLPSSPPTTWFVTYKIFTIECIIWRMYSCLANTNHCSYVWNFLRKYWAKFWLNPCLALQCLRYFCLLVLFNPQKQNRTFVTLTYEETNDKKHQLYSFFWMLFIIRLSLTQAHQTETTLLLPDTSLSH